MCSPTIYQFKNVEIEVILPNKDIPKNNIKTFETVNNCKPLYRLKKFVKL